MSSEICSSCRTRTFVERPTEPFTSRILNLYLFDSQTPVQPQTLSLKILQNSSTKGREKETLNFFTELSKVNDQLTKKKNEIH